MDWIGNIPAIDGALALAVAVAALVAVLTRHRGGRFRGLTGWVGFWLLFGAILVCLSRVKPWMSLTLLGLLMFGGLRTYFFLAPVRPRDRYAVLATYLAIPFVLYPGFTGAQGTFLATVPVVLFLVFPVLLSVGTTQEGLLDSMGRILLGVVLFVFCAAHLGLLVRWEQASALELYGVLVLAAELPQRVAGRYGKGNGWLRPTVGVAVGWITATVVGYEVGPWVGIVEEDAARAGLFVAIAVTMGGLVTDAVMRDLGLGSTAARVGRAAFLDRAIPAVYAAPVFFHYLNHFA